MYIQKKQTAESDKNNNFFVASNNDSFKLLMHNFFTCLKGSYLRLNSEWERNLDILISNQANKAVKTAKSQ